MTSSVSVSDIVCCCLLLTFVDENVESVETLACVSECVVVVDYSLIFIPEGKGNLANKK